MKAGERMAREDTKARNEVRGGGGGGGDVGRRDQGWGEVECRG